MIKSIFSNTLITWLFIINSSLLVITSCKISSEEVNPYLSELPSDLELIEETPQVYEIVVDYYTRDLYGNLLNLMKISAEYTRALPEGMVRWNNVNITKNITSKDSQPESELQEYMENFTYFPSGEILNESFFKDFPAGVTETRVLIWDMMSIEVWAWNYFDLLKLNEEFKPQDSEETIQMAGAGLFTNKDLKLTWTGVSEIKSELVALIEFQSLFNPLDMNNGIFSMKGRTNYWGTIGVSLKDKQIEFARLYEDGILDMQFAGKEENTLINVFREIKFNKITEKCN